MTRLLYIKGSPRIHRSHSRDVAEAFIKECCQADPNLEVQERDLFCMTLPELDERTLSGKYNLMHGKEVTETDRETWSSVESIIEDFVQADKYVFAVPMWNFHLPYRLKHYMDIIAQPTYTFTSGPDGYKGLTKGKACVVYSRGGSYPDPSPINFQEPYFQFFLNFIGITDIVNIAVQPTIAEGPEGQAEAKRKALDEAKEKARSF